jgi:hypothetical protein
MIWYYVCALLLAYCYFHMHGFALPFFVFPVGKYEILFSYNNYFLSYGNIVELFDQTYLLRGLCVMRVWGVSVPIQNSRTQ